MSRVLEGVQDCCTLPVRQVELPWSVYCNVNGNYPSHLLAKGLRGDWDLSENGI